MLKTLLLATALTACLAGSAFAGPCDDDLKKIDKALTSQDVAADQKAQVKDMRNQAEKLCSAGNVEEGADVLSEAKAMLAIE